jgi:hypothetical protein
MLLQILASILWVRNDTNDDDWSVFFWTTSEWMSKFFFYLLGDVDTEQLGSKEEMSKFG